MSTERIETVVSRSSATPEKRAPGPWGAWAPLKRSSLGKPCVALGACLAAQLLLSGCGEGGQDGSDSGGAPGETGGGAGASTGGDTSSGGSGGTGSGGRDSTEAPTTRELSPHPVGASWTYEILSMPECLPNPGSREVREALEFEGQTEAFLITDLCGDPDFYMAYSGDDVLQWIPEQGWIVALDGPVEEGKTWTIRVAEQEVTFLWERQGTVETEAGNFEDCWVRRSVSEQQGTNVYCPGVGSVYRQFATGGRWQLTEFEL